MIGSNGREIEIALVMPGALETFREVGGDEWMIHSSSGLVMATGVLFPHQLLEVSNDV